MPKLNFSVEAETFVSLVFRRDLCAKISANSQTYMEKKSFCMEICVRAIHLLRFQPPDRKSDIPME